MCGILAIINKHRKLKADSLARATSVIRHRGPDDEGFLTWSPGEASRVWFGDDTATSTKAHYSYDALDTSASFHVGMGHRRLSIIDLSPAGYQPMRLQDAGLSIVYNGEIYNYPELRDELIKAGHRFNGSSDTEVILHAWAQWGPSCLNRFNGMFAFVLLDEKAQQLYAVRDRFGVKPLYYYQNDDVIYFASEIKQIRSAPGHSLQLNEAVAAQFLTSGANDETEHTYDVNIRHLRGGHYMHIDLAMGTEPRIVQWYDVSPARWKGSFEDAATQFRELLTDAIRLRLRSDVKVGSCLSGGLDSSSIVCLMARLLGKEAHAGQETVTACFPDSKYDEWEFAQQVISRTGVTPHRVFPQLLELQEELDSVIHHQDEPFSSTSMFSQWCVFKETNRAGLKVMIDGQGADEQLAGYGGNDLALYTGMVKQLQLSRLMEEARWYKAEKGTYPRGFILNALQVAAGKGLTALLPTRLQLKDKVSTAAWVKQSPGERKTYSHSLQEQLIGQLYGNPLPSLLRYEDHNSMAWSVESRTPFLDYRLVEFNLGLPAHFIYNKGVRKYVLRQAMKDILPPAVAQRKDKMGFVTPEEMWIKGEGKAWFLHELELAYRNTNNTLLDVAAAKAHVSAIMNNTIPYDNMPWRIICFNKWLNCS
jgi:asparagine synthase (glutamine-hydrolysing)